jgi:hypothetical protein
MRIVSPHRGLQLGWINVLALCPFDQIGWAVRWVAAPTCEDTGVDRLVDVDMASVIANVRFSADGAIERGRDDVV